MAYAIANLVENLDKYQHHHDHLDLDFQTRIEPFLKKARAFRAFLASSLPRLPHEYLVTIRIADAAHKAEDIVEVHIRNQILPTLCEEEEDDQEPLPQLDDGLADVAEEFESIKEEISKIVDDPERFTLADSFYREVSWLQNSDPARRNVVAILEGDFQTLKGRLIGGSSELQVIPIFGKMGMGKRTLARRLYSDSSMSSRFHAIAWVNTSSEIDLQVLLLNILDVLGKLTYRMNRQTADQLGVHLRDALRYRRYLIVLHDLMNEHTLAKLRKYLPDDNVGSRILLTSWNLDEATLSRFGELHLIRVLSESESWLLFCQQVFGKEHCPHEFEAIGKIIVGKCRGIPQVISLIAGHLATSEKTTACWKFVAEPLGIYFDIHEDHDQFMGAVSLMIYFQLPYYLRSCYLYIGAFREFTDIQASKIVKLWIAEGFVRQSANDSSEDLAEAYLRILVDKNLLLLTRDDPRRRVRTFQMQSFLRYNCMFLAGREKFLVIHGLPIIDGEVYEKDMRRVSAHPFLQNTGMIKLPPLARTLLSVGHESIRLAPVFLRLRYLRVLDLCQIEFYQFPRDILQLVLLRYVAITCHSGLPTSFSNLKYLQALIICRLPSFRAFSLHFVMWELEQLRHIKCKETFIWYFPKDGEKVVHRNLQTLTNAQLLGVTNDFLEVIPNIRKLGLFCNIPMCSDLDLSCLDKLERLKCSSDWSLASRNFLSHLKLSNALRKLTLSLCRISCGFMKAVGSLPNLEQLRLKKSDFLGLDGAEPEWETAEGGFDKLISLEMIHLNLVHWKAHAIDFPRLERLVIQNCYALVEIPLGIGDIQTLGLIQVDNGSPSALASSVKMKEKSDGRGDKSINFLFTRS